MKKLLLTLLLICSLVSFGQEKIALVKSSTPSQVGDTLVIDVKYQGSAGTAKLTQFDFQFNNKLLALQSRTWKLTSTSAQKAYNSWNGYKWGNNTATTDIDGEYADYVAGNTSYGTNADWSVERVTIQDVTAFANNDEWIQYKFTIKDKGTTNYSDYSNLINLNWGYLNKSDGTDLPVDGEVDGGTSLTLTGIQGGAAGNVSISISSNVIANNIGDGADFSYTIITKEDMDDGDSTNDVIVASGTFDTAGDATVTGLENDVEYAVWVTIDDSKTYLDNVVTVSDLALIFQEAIGAGNSPNGSTTTFDYYIQKLLGDVYFPEGDDPFTINFQDSYEVLAYLQGVTSTNTAYITKTGGAFNVSGIKSTFGNKGETTDYPTFSPIIKPTDTNKSFDFAHALAGDVNFSHSYQPANTNDFKISSMVIGNSSTLKTTSFNASRYQSVDANIDLVSQIVDGKVVFSINSQVAGMIGTQFNITYDNTRIELEDVIFDTGNEMTNFANHRGGEGKINIGSFDQSFEQTVKQGTPYKLVFKPLVELQNASGLVTFKVHEGVRADGTQINLRME